MDWWEFAEHSGYPGDDLNVSRITCAFCDAEGNFGRVQHEEKRHPATGKVLNYDILRCGNCGNLTMVFWSAARFGGRHGNHNFTTVPRPQKTTRYPEHWPPDVGRCWVQAQRSLEVKNWDAAALMARSAVQLITRYQQAVGSNLKQEIDDLAGKGFLPPVMKEWSHEVRVLGNENAHPSPGAAGTAPEDAKDVVRFLSYLLTVVYNLPHEIEQYRDRKKTRRNNK
jgi:Domain of unknown function (DUF4145)